jgi:drug/metabolite transporter (DMT)-like permease
LLLGILALIRSGSGLSSNAGFAAIALAALGLATSVVTHRRWGHGPESTEPMSTASFAAGHPAFLVAGSIIVVGLVMVSYARRRRSRGTGRGPSWPSAH